MENKYHCPACRRPRIPGDEVTRPQWGSELKFITIRYECGSSIVLDNIEGHLRGKFVADCSAYYNHRNKKTQGF